MRKTPSEPIDDDGHLHRDSHCSHASLRCLHLAMCPSPLLLSPSGPLGSAGGKHECSKDVHGEASATGVLVARVRMAKSFTADAFVAEASF